MMSALILKGDVLSAEIDVRYVPKVFPYTWGRGEGIASTDGASDIEKMSADPTRHT